jgi:hypothetical protein
MHKGHFLSALLLSLAPSLAIAASQDIQLTATVPGYCSISSADTPAAVVQDLVVDSTGRISTQPVSLNFPVTCNKASSLSLSTTNKGLRGPDAPYFEKVINYSVQADGVFGGLAMQTDSYQTGSDGQSIHKVSSENGVDGFVSIKVTPFANVIPLAAGSYSDTLRVTISPLQ